MRKYTLASLDARISVDLLDYEDVITEAVHAVMPQAKVTVTKDCYHVSPTPTQGQAVKIGRKICESDLSQHCVKISKLFSSIKIEEEANEKRNDQQLHGGHY